MQTTDIITTKEGIIVAAKAARGTAASLAHDLQIVAVSAVMHVIEHTDPRILMHIMKISAGVNRAAMAEFFGQNLPLEIVKDGDDYKYQDWDADSVITVDDSEEYKQWLTDLLNKQWFTYKKPKAPSVLDVPKKVAKLLKDITAHLKAPIDGDVLPADKIAAIKLAGENVKAVDWAAALSAMPAADFDSIMTQMGKVAIDADSVVIDQLVLDEAA